MTRSLVRRGAETEGELVERLTKEIGHILTGHDRIVQSAVIADLLAIWLAGHAPYLRNGILRRHLKLVRELVLVNEKAFFGKEGHPDSKETSH
jgi:hypothetical protein